MTQEETGAADVTRDLLAIQSSALEAIRNYSRYLRNAENAGLPEVAYFVHLLMEEDSARAAHCQGLLRRLGSAGTGSEYGLPHGRGSRRRNMTAPSTEQPPPGQEQEYPGRTAEMDPRPRDEMRDYEGRGLLAGSRALITGGDSGIGRAVAVAFAKEGADVAIAYLSEIEDEDAARTAELVRAVGRRCVTIRGDLAIEDNCQRAVEQTVTELGGLDVLVNNVATQEPVDDLAELTTGQWERTFRVNVHSYFWTTRAALKHLPDGGAIINTSSINGLRGNKTLIDYAATKGAILALTYSLAQALQDRGIRVNSVAPGPVWTPLIPATSARKGSARSAARCQWGVQRTRTRLPRPTSSSPAGACPATTQERSSPPSGAKLSRDEETSVGIILIQAAVFPLSRVFERYALEARSAVGSSRACAAIVARSA